MFSERKILVMRLHSVSLAVLAAVGLLTIGADSASAGGYVRSGSPGGYFSAGNPGGLQSGSSYLLAPTPANQAFERNNAWANYAAQNRPVRVPNVSTGISGSGLQHNAVTP
jgi:hypothetical protein